MLYFPTQLFDKLDSLSCNSLL